MIHPHSGATLSSILSSETNIVWLHDPLRFKYLRETLCLFTRGRGHIRDPYPPPWLLVGYAEVRRSGGRGMYQRRVWWLKDYDYDYDPGGLYATGWPMEAVDPASIRIGVPSAPPREPGPEPMANGGT